VDAMSDTAAVVDDELVLAVEVPEVELEDEEASDTPW